ncbi:putative nuclease HARBI1 [Cinnamomum micranthum f. kanehirae]|uniref:Putative nuclease HARBI1 n=1 Tax=Cinnamomum micranthum f. kanehirae TaxID=337451 RepID=A0A3S3MNX5_9MAGN|nr:putative nuclease HARBI1 [Cinnamomum micranthum f. kanehirae]
MLTVHGPEFSKDKLKNRFKSYEKWYSAMKSMLNLSGFGWDEERKKVTAEEGIWDDYIADCIKAIDGTHIAAWVRLEDQVRYRNRKGGLSQNVMAVVSFDMRFHYVSTGWEGSASDSKILQHTVWRRPQNKLHVPTVERTFAVFKQRFALLQTAPRYPIMTQVKIVVACCVLHNFIRQWNVEDDLFQEALNEMMEEADLNDERYQDIEGNNVGGPTDVDKQFMTDFREQLSKDM